MSWRIIHGDVREVIKTLPDASVQCIVTSPPYWGLRDYGAEGQIGLEPTIHHYVGAIASLFSQDYLWRVLKDDGTVWLNLGDSYNAYNGGAGPGSKLSKTQTEQRPKLATGYGLQSKDLKPKDLVGVPWRVAFALQERGWYLRSDIIWHKPNPMPESVTDRPTKSHEYIFLLTKSERYHYDAEAIQDASQGFRERRDPGIRKGVIDPKIDGLSCGGSDGFRNARSVWTINTQPYPEAHFATFPEELPTRCIKAGSKPGDVVLDPFCGAGTTGLVADRLNRDFIGIELNPAYIAIAEKRISSVTPLLDAAEAVTDDAQSMLPELFA